MAFVFDCIDYAIYCLSRNGFCEASSVSAMSRLTELKIYIFADEHALPI